MFLHNVTFQHTHPGTGYQHSLYFGGLINLEYRITANNYVIRFFEARAHRPHNSGRVSWTTENWLSFTCLPITSGIHQSPWTECRLIDCPDLFKSNHNLPKTTPDTGSSSKQRPLTPSTRFKRIVLWPLQQRFDSNHMASVRIIWGLIMSDYVLRVGERTLMLILKKERDVWVVRNTYRRQEEPTCWFFDCVMWSEWHTFDTSDFRNW
jgi:hypothetical protein